MSLSPKDRTAILSSIKKLVIAKHINVSNVDYDAWTRLLEERTPQLVAFDDAGFEDAIRDLLKELGTSHVVLYRDVPDRLAPQHTIGATLRAISCAGDARWMFLDVFEDGPAHRAGVTPGDILRDVDRNPVSPPKLPSFGIGRSHELAITDPAGQVPRTIAVDVPARKGTKAQPPLIAPKALAHRILEDNIGLLKVGWFTATMGLAFAKDLDAHMDELKNGGCDRLIVDLRGNIGGGLGFARLASYMCPGQMPIGQSLTPKRLRSGYDRSELPSVPMPNTISGLVVTLTRFLLKDRSLVLLTQGLGAQPFHGRIVVLVNEWTNSAAEIVANFAGENRLAILVGNKTAGNVLGAQNFKLPGEYWLRLPVFGWFGPQGESIEGKGVAPDVVLDIDAVKLKAGIDEQLNTAVEIVKSLPAARDKYHHPSLTNAQRQ
jgi:carboxyl-terminal processing protease